jgi:hypothetical protein
MVGQGSADLAPERGAISRAFFVTRMADFKFRLSFVIQDVDSTPFLRDEYRAH